MVRQLFRGVHALWQKRVFRVAFMGVIAVAIQSTLFVILGLWLTLVRPSTAVLISTEVALLINFYLNNRFSFNGSPYAPLPLRLVRYHTTVVGSFFCQWLFVFVAEQMTTNMYVLLAAYAAGALLGFGINYTGYRLWVWRHHDASSFETRT